MANKHMSTLSTSFATWETQIKPTMNYPHIYILNILFHYGLSQDIDYNSLCYTLGSCCLHMYKGVTSLCSRLAQHCKSTIL